VCDAPILGGGNERSRDVMHQYPESVLDIYPYISTEDDNLVTRRGFTKYLNKQNFVHDDQEQNGTKRQQQRSSVSGYSPNVPVMRRRMAGQVQQVLDAPAVGRIRGNAATRATAATTGAAVSRSQKP
jgi:hypothetical protein